MKALSANHWSARNFQHLSFQIRVFSGYLPRNGIARSYNSSTFSFFVFFFKELPSYSPWWLHQFHIPTNKGSPSSPLLQILSSIYYLQTFLGDEPHGLQDLSSPTRDCMLATTVKALSPNHWTTKVFPDSKI